MRVLVAYASVHGGTADIARAIADELGAAAPGLLASHALPVGENHAPHDEPKRL